MNGRVILQDTTTGLYLAADGSWVKSCQQAKVFEHTWGAFLQGLEHADKRMQVVWCFKDPDLNMYAPVKAEGDIRPCTSCPMARLKSN